ncbi:MAG TPA: hypothetical protein VKA25_14025 [Gemmatimonadales bacterium]|nr:hypothetical protein [Gemmatimonadales bacterium]
MKRLLRGSVVLAVAVGFLSCSGDPTSDLRQPAGITATPTTVFVDVGETKPVIASLIDEQGNQVASDFTITDVGAGVTVVQDSTFQNTTAGVNIDNQVRFQVTATSIANSSFTLNAGGKTLVVPVRVTPATVAIAISNQAPALGDTITITAPAGVLFTDSSEVTFAGGPAGDIVSMSPDRTQLVIVPGPNVTGVVTVAHTTVNYDEGLDFTITSTDTVATSPPLTDLTGAIISNPTPALGEIVTLTLPPTVKVLPVAALDTVRTIGETDTIGVLADSGLLVQGATNPRDVAVSVDSSVITFVPAPNSDSTVTVRGVVNTRLPQFPQILSTPFKITTPVVDSVPSTFSSAAPGAGAPVTLNSTDPNFTFTGGTQVIVGADTAITSSTSANTVTFVPIPGSTGQVSVAGTQVVGFPLVLPSTSGSLTATNAAVAATGGTGSPATAPTIPTPAPGEYTGKVDGTSFGFATCGDVEVLDTPCQVYKFVVAADGVFDFAMRWSNTSDMGLYFLDATGTTDLGVGDCDALANGATNQPESCAVELVAGTYFLAVVPFGVYYGEEDPNWVAIRITQE